MGIANVISLKSLEEKYRVTYDSKSSGGCFVVHTSNGPIEFKRCPDTSFPYIDLDDVSHGDKGAMLVQTVRGNYEGFTKREVEKAREVRTLQGRLGHISDTELKGLLKNKEKVSHKVLKNSNLTIDDLENSRVIYGPSVPRLKGTSVRHKPTRAEPNFVRIPRDIIDMNRYVTLVVDVMFVCGLPFLISLSRRIRFVTVEFIPKRTAGELSNGLKNILKLYNRAGFIIQCACMDNEFEPLTKKLLGKLVVNTTAADEHVGEIERKIQHVKTRARSLKASLPFKKLPNAVIKALIYNVTMWMNALVSKQGVSDVYSPRELLLRTQLDTSVHAKATFGSYCEAYSRPKQTNSQEERTTSCICLGPTGNFQGTYKFLNLNTGEVIKRAEFTELPMPDSVIKKVEFWADRDKQEARDSLSFRNRNNERFSWDDDLLDEPLIEDNAPEPPSAPFPDIPAEMPGIELERDETPAVTPDEAPTLKHRLRLAHANADINPNIIPDSVENDRSGNTYHNQNNYVYNVQNNQRNIANVQNNIVIAEEGEIEEAEANEDDVPELVYRDDSSDDEDDDYVPSEQEDVELEADEELEDRRSAQEEEETVRRSRSGRPIKERKYYHDEYQFLQSRRKWAEADAVERCIAEAEAENDGIEFVKEDPIELYEGEEAIFGSIMMQLSLKAGLKKWGKRGEESAMKEMTQLHDLEAFFQRDPSTMTQEQRKGALSSLIFLKEKSSGEIKTRTCINGAPQREYIRKEDAASPTASTDSVFMIGAINAHEKRDVVTADLPGAFLNTVTDELVFMVLKGELCELMVRVNPKIYRRYVTTDKKGNPILYVQLYKSMYGLLRSALLFYRKLRGELEAFGFVINPYDPCVANRISKSGKQQTVLWHVDDLMMSHVEPGENTKLLEYLTDIYGEKMTITRGSHHRYLGMDMDFSKRGILGISMVKYIDEVLEEFPELITKTSRTPHTNNLFKVRPESEATFLSEEQAQQFHRTVAQLLFLSCRARRDIQTAVSFLTTRVKKPDTDDWGKGKRVLQYLKWTRSMPLNLTIDNLQSTKWLVDSSHGVHEDGKGQTGAGMILGRGAIISFSRKQKSNTRSSTESELVGVDDTMPSILWSLYFLQEQGYGTTHATVYQDNKSAILLETNGKFSSSKRTKHIKMKFFFVKDKVDDGEIKIEHLPYEKMWIDMLTKPSQGIRFESDRSELQNVPVHWPDESLQPQTTPTNAASLAPQECVGNHVKRPQPESARSDAQKRITRQVGPMTWAAKRAGAIKRPMARPKRAAE
jgi:hypothetical protein